MEHTSSVTRESAKLAGVKFTVARVSLGRRLELAQQIREMGLKAEFLSASPDAHDQVELAVIERRIECLYLRWGLVSVEGLTIDGEPATKESLIERGPEVLTDEILSCIRGEISLSEAERKNS
jgi:hypothetical protein